jgi:hypothetical protein
MPESLEAEIERMIKIFWWGSQRGSCRGINWMKWEKLTNLDSDTILIRIFEVKYSHGDFLGAALGHNPSYVGRII